MNPLGQATLYQLRVTGPWRSPTALPTTQLLPEMHDHLRTVIVAPMTSKSRPAPFRMAVTHAGQKGLILLDQLRAVDKVRLARRLGAVSTKTLVGTLGILQEVFAE